MAKTTNASPEFATIMAQAQDAVAAITDPELKRIAFERVLDKLLGTAKSLPAKGEGGTGKQGAKKTHPTTANNHGPKGRIEQLIEENYFKTPRSLADIQKELAHQGFHIPTTTLSGPLQRLCQSRRLRRRKQKVGNKETYVYSNW